jgi:hypothetical protein
MPSGPYDRSCIRPQPYPSFGVFGLEIPDVLQFPLALQAKLLVHMTFISQDRSLVPHRGFRLSNEKMQMSSGLVIPRILTHPLRDSSPG